VIFCGTSGPLPIAGRAKPCTAIQAGGKLDWRLARDGMTIDLPAGSPELHFGAY